MTLIKIGTRKSSLAKAQTDYIAGQLQQRAQEYGQKIKIETIEITTKGDQILDKDLSKIGSKGLFTAELEQALQSGEIDLAVHSLKDLPTDINEELPLIAISERADARDCIVLSPEYDHIDSLDDLKGLNLRLGSSSERRTRQIEDYLPNIKTISIRGNIQTRLRKVDEHLDGLDGAILAVAGLERAGLRGRINIILSPDISTPAPGQGALAVQAHQRVRDSEIYPLLESINCPEAALLTAFEREILRRYGGGCSTPLGIYVDGEMIYATLYRDGEMIRIREQINSLSDELIEQVLERLGH